MQTVCGLVRASGITSRASQSPGVVIAPRLHSRPLSATRRQRRQVRAAGIPVTGPADSYAEEPVSVSAETAMISQNTMATMAGKIKEALETDQVEISDTYGDGRHVSIDVVSPLFEGQSSVKRQRMVYKAIWLELQETVHAVDAMTTKTPHEASG